MDINRNFVSTRNTSGSGNPCTFIVIHETDNTNSGAGAQRHASAQAAGHFAGMSVHYYCGSDGIYQAANHTMKCWHVGRNYVDNPPVAGVSNANSIGIEICVNSDGNYTKARQNAIELTKHLMKTLSVTASRVVRHYDAKGKYCPRRMLNTPSFWTDFKVQIGNTSSTTTPQASTSTPVTNYYRVGTAWKNGVCEKQVGAYTSLANAKFACKAGYKVFDWNGKVVYEVAATATPTTSTRFQVRVSIRDLNIRTGPGTSYTALDKKCPVGVYTITETKTANGHTWGKLLSGAGWIALEYAKRI